MDDKLRRMAPSDLLLFQTVGPVTMPDAVSAAPSRHPIQAAGEDAPIGTIRTCPECGDVVERRETTPNATGRTVRYWSDCRCIERRRARSEAAEAYSRRRQEEIDSAVLGDPGYGRVEHLSLNSFEPERLRSIPIDDDHSYHPYELALQWFGTIIDRESITRYGEGPPGALYLWSHGKGRGKTHLAGAIFNRARELHLRVAFIEELSYLSRYRHMPFGMEREHMLLIPGDRAWLTVIDDLGRLDPGTGRGAIGVRNAWNDVISRRYAAHRFTIFTSNYTPDELVARGTIDDAAYSRIYEMTRGAVVIFDGEDQRLLG